MYRIVVVLFLALTGSSFEARSGPPVGGSSIPSGDPFGLLFRDPDAGTVD